MDDSVRELKELAVAEEAMELAFEASSFYGGRLPEPLRERDGRHGVRAKSRWWLHDSGAEGRCALIHSSRVEILNLMVFPANAGEVPIFASEIILMGETIKVAVVDWQMAGGWEAMREDDRQCLAELKARWALGLTPGGDLPDWAQEHFTPHCLYTRPLTSGETSKVEQGFAGYLAAWFRFCAERLGPAGRRVEESGLLNRYLNHHVEHTPGRPFLTRVFGADWAEAYFRRFMYAPLGRVAWREEVLGQEVCKLDRNTGNQVFLP